MNRLPYRRHPNGGGKLYGEDKVFVSADSFVDRHSEIVGESHVTASRVWRSMVYDSTIHGAAISNGVILIDGVVDGPVRLVGPWELTGPFYIRSGEWHRPPRHKVLSHESGIHVGLTESVNGRAFIACNERLVSDWLKHGRKIGRKMGWPADLIEDAYRFMEEMADSPMGDSATVPGRKRLTVCNPATFRIAIMTTAQSE